MALVVIAIVGVCLKRKMSTATDSDDVDAYGESAYGASQGAYSSGKGSQYSAGSTTSAVDASQTYDGERKDDVDGSTYV